MKIRMCCWQRTIKNWQWSGVARVSCILHHIWARPAILIVAGKGRGGMFSFFCFFIFIPVPLSSLSLKTLTSPLLSLLSLFSLSLGDDTKWPTRVDMPLNSNTIEIHQQSQTRSPQYQCTYQVWWKSVDIYSSCHPETFLWSFSLFRWFKKGSCQFLAKECAQYWLTA